MIVRRVHPEVGEPIDTAAPGAREELAALYPRPAAGRSVRVNLVTTVDGAVQGADGTSASLSNAADRAVLGAIRSTAELVLVGASTLRAEGGLLPRRTPLAVMSRTGELSSAALDPDRAHAPVTVIGPPAARERAAATLGVPHDFLALPGDEALELQLPAALEALAARGQRHVVCEGGPIVVRGLLDLGLVDELCLTTSPRLAGRDAPVAFGGRSPAPVDAPLVQLLVDEQGYAYARRRLR